MEDGDVTESEKKKIVLLSAQITVVSLLICVLFGCFKPLHFLHLGAVESSCEHKIDILSPQS